MAFCVEAGQSVLVRARTGMVWRGVARQLCRGVLRCVRVSQSRWCMVRRGTVGNGSAGLGVVGSGSRGFVWQLRVLFGWVWWVQAVRSWLGLVWNGPVWR
jgi:hypothetical protein